MPYIENPFNVGDYALCVNDNFPIVTTTGDKSQIGSKPDIHPQKGEVCCVDEILGEFLRFDEYDFNDSWNWWIHTHFKKLTQEEVEDHYEEIGQNAMMFFESIK
jgi:hypothetical protein